MRRATLIVVSLLAGSIACASSEPDPLACPDLMTPVAVLGADAVPDPKSCFALPEVGQYMGAWRVAMLRHWKAPATRRPRKLRVLLTINLEGAVEHYCIQPGGTGASGLRPSVIEALESFDPPAAPTESVAACVAHKRLAADFRMAELSPR